MKTIYFRGFLNDISALEESTGRMTDLHHACAMLAEVSRIGENEFDGFHDRLSTLTATERPPARRGPLRPQRQQRVLKHSGEVVAVRSSVPSRCEAALL